MLRWMRSQRHILLSIHLLTTQHVILLIVQYQHVGMWETQVSGSVSKMSLLTTHPLL